MKISNISAKGEKLLTWLMSVVSMSAAIYIYTTEWLNWYTLLAAALSAGFIKLFDFFRTKKLGGLLYFGLFIIVGFIPDLLVGRNEAFALIRWFFSGAQAEDTRASFMLVLTIAMGFFLTSAIYYFTQVIYRSAMLILISLIPFALAVKTVVSLPYAYAALMAAFNLLVLIIEGRKNILKGAKASKGSSVMVYTDFFAAAVILALIAPKPSVTPFYEQFEAMANRFQFGGSNSENYIGRYKDASGSTEDMLRGESQLLYFVSTSDPVYLKAQVFDIYNSEIKAWTQRKEMRGDKDWQETAPLLSYEKLGNVIRKAAAGNPSVYEIYPQAENMQLVTDSESYSMVYARNYPAVYVIAPLRATTASLVNTGADYSALTTSGELFTNMPLLPPNADYTVRYYSEQTQQTLINSGFCDISAEDYKDFLYKAQDEFEYGTDEYSIILEFIRMHNLAEAYYYETETKVSPEIQALADEITAGLKFDYQKAQAIEEYFYNNDFVYSIAYEAPKESDTPEFFLFESKTGICTDFATAYTLLARAAGLTVRYVEGFVPQAEENAQNLYSIYTENAHAYPEVYIPGAGWVIYEPTVADLTGGRNSEADENREPDYLAIFLTAMVFVIGFVIFILLVIFTPKITEFVFRIKVKHTPYSKAVIMLYNRYTGKFESRYGISCKAMTPEQTAATAKEKTGISLEPVTKPFIAACYGSTEIDAAAFEEAYICYAAQVKEMSRKNRKRKE